MKVIVTGGRTYLNKIQLFETLDAIMRSENKIDVLIQGGASGADSLAMCWANTRNVECKTYWAQWDKFGKEAGRKRNRLMLFENQDAVVIAFKGGRGTGHCVEMAKSLNMKVILIKDTV